MKNEPTSLCRDICPEDGSTITALELSSDNELCGVGDKSGRIVILRLSDGEKVIDFKSHDAEFDYLKSLEIEQKINKIRFCRQGGPCPLLLSTNDKTIKLWKIGKDRWSRRPEAVSKRVFANAHAYHINSISVNSDGETFCSSDDLRINLWNLEVSVRAFNVVDLKPHSMEDLTEVITSSCFHPTRCFELLFASSKGTCKLFDLRRSARCGEPVAMLGAPSADGFYGEIVASVSDAKFVDDDIVCTRDFLELRLFDLRRADQPIAVFPIHDHLKPRLPDLYDADRIFDKFECTNSSPRHLFTGTYANACVALDATDLTTVDLVPAHPPQNADLEYSVLHVSANAHSLAFASGDSVHFYHLDQRPDWSKNLPKHDPV